MRLKEVQRFLRRWEKVRSVLTGCTANMIRAGEAGGALEVILRRLSEFMERASALRRKVKGAMVYPIVVISVAVGILSFIMITIVPQFKTIFDDFGTTLPPMTQNLIDFSSLLSTGRVGGSGDDPGRMISAAPRLVFYSTRAVLLYVVYQDRENEQLRCDGMGSFHAEDASFWPAR